MKKRFFAMLIAVLILFSQVTAFAYTLDSASKNSEEKITDELKETLMKTDDNEYIPVRITLESYDESEIYTVISKKLGVVIDENSEEEYIKLCSSVLQNEIENLAKETDINLKKLSLNDTADFIMKNDEISKAMSKSEIVKCLEENMDIKEIIEIAIRTNYISLWRNTRKSLNDLKRKEFLSKRDKSKYTNLRENPLLPIIEFDCLKQYIFELQDDPRVENIDCNNEQWESLCNEEPITRSANDGLGYHMIRREWSNYGSAGIKIGVLEVSKENNGALFDPDNPHLAGKREQGLLTQRTFGFNSQSTLGISEHATTVLSIICGNPVLKNETNDNYYQGFAPNATVFYANYKSDLGDKESLNIITDALMWLIFDKNVSVINMSFRWNKKNNGQIIYKYNDLDKMIDSLTVEYRVLFVSSAGNINYQTNSENKVTSPGLAYNAITVGNVDYLNYSNGQYSLSNSCFSEDEYLTNKPDISAFGTDIYMLGQDRELDYRGSGTSFAAPMVTGTVALMLKANPSLIGAPDRTKAILLSSSNEDAIKTENNEARFTNYENQIVRAAGITREKSGVGLLNVIASIVKANEAICWSYRIVNFTSQTSKGSQIFNIQSNTTIRVGFVFEKAKDDLVYSKYGIDINLRVIESATGATVFDSMDVVSLENVNTQNDNVELFDIYFKVGGNYRFEVYADSFITTTYPTYITMIATCACENPQYLTQNVNSIATRKECTCGFCLMETFYEAFGYKSFGAGDFVYTLVYNFIYNNGQEVNYKRNLEYACYINNYSNYATITLNDTNFSYNAYGFIEETEYMITVYNANGEYCSTHYVVVTVSYNSNTQTYSVN